MTQSADFDEFADRYQTDLEQALGPSGESQDYFARGRVDWVANFLGGCQVQAKRILDYGCGIGGTARLLREIPGVETVIGVDLSEQSLEVARARHRTPGVQFQRVGEYKPEGQIDLAYCNGVFHHIPLAERSQAVRYVGECLRPGGLFAFWENNPWNPGARWVMSRCPFDRNAVTLTPEEAAHLLETAGFEIVCTKFLFIFPRWLAFLRFLEPSLSGAPLGAQYIVVGRKAVG